MVENCKSTLRVRSRPRPAMKAREMQASERAVSPRIVIQYANQFADLLSPLARHLRSRHGVDVVLVHRGKRNLPNPAVYDFDVDAFVELVDLEEVLQNRSVGDIESPGKLAERVAAVESSTGIDILEILRSDRHLGHGFVVGAKYSRSRYMLANTYDQAVDIALRLAETLDNVLARNRPLAVVAAPSNMIGMTLQQLADGRGMPVRALAYTLTGKNFYWAVDRYYRPGNLAEKYRRLCDHADATPANMSAEVERKVSSPERFQAFRKSIPARASFRALGRALYLCMRRKAGDIIKRRRHTYGGYLLRDQLREIVSIWHVRRGFLKDKPLLPELPEDMPYVFFPLAVEPEATLMAEAPMADNQLACIDWLVKTVPAGWRVIVKEHPGLTTPRPAGFWHQLHNYPNLLVAATMESGEALASQARALAVINGSLGTQAAVAGTPVLTFHPHFPAVLLPHVFHADSYAGTKSALRRIENGEIPPLAERRRCGQALMAALEFDAVPVADANLLVGVSGGQKVEGDDVSVLSAALIDSIGVAAPESSVGLPEAGPVPAQQTGIAL